MNLAHRPVDIFQVFGETPKCWPSAAGWREPGCLARRLPAQLEDFAALVISLGQPLADQRVSM
jgi:hypothetical protein